nr:linoleate 13S-lipoxygenase 2-1, chloroplastic-like [Ipomoea batatas]
MMKPQLQHATSKTLIIPWYKPFVYGGESTVAFRPAVMKPTSGGKRLRKGTGKSSSLQRYRPCNIKAVATTSSTEKSTSVKAVVTVQSTVGGFLSNLNLTRVLDDINDLLGKTLLLDIVAAELDHSKSIYSLFNINY